MGNSDVSESIVAHKTRESLLLRLKDEDNEHAWREFHCIYGRLIFGYSLHYGISYAEAEDIVQEVCVKVFRRIIKFEYSPAKGRFRGWLKTVTRNTVVDYLRRKQSRRNKTVEFREMKQLELMDDKDVDEELWQLEWRKALYEAAMERVRQRVGEETLKTFNEYVLGQRSAEEIAAGADMKTTSIYSIKNRVLKYIKEEVEKLLEDEEVL